MQIVFDQPEIKFFRSLKYTNKSGIQNELSGVIALNERGKIDNVTVFFGDKMNSHLPFGALTFHTHTLLPKTKQIADSSTDVPSPTDLVTIGMAILYNGAQEHLVFTPTYVYTITWFKEAYESLKNLSKTTSASAITDRLYNIMQGEYDKLISKHGKNYGISFINEWFDIIRQIGFDIRKFNQGEDVVFVMGPVTSDTSLNSLIVISGDDKKYKKQYIVYKAIAATFIGVIVVASVWAIKRSKNKTNLSYK